MYGWWYSIDTEPILIALLEGPISMPLVEIEPMTSLIMSWVLLSFSHRCLTGILLHGE